MAEIYDIAQEFRADLLKQERAAAVRMTDIYGTAYSRISAQLKKLLEQIEAARAAGQAINPAWLLRQQRYAELMIQVEEQIGKFADAAEAIITKQPSAAVNKALKDSQALMKAAAEQGPAIGVSFNKINPAAVENLAGFLGNGSPLSALLKQLPADGRQVVERGLMNGIVQGRNPRAIASEIRTGLGGNLNRALTIAGTETLRAYRETSQATPNRIY